MLPFSKMCVSHSVCDTRKSPGFFSPVGAGAAFLGVLFLPVKRSVGNNFPTGRWEVVSRPDGGVTNCVLTHTGTLFSNDAYRKKSALPLYNLAENKTEKLTLFCFAKLLQLVAECPSTQLRSSCVKLSVAKLKERSSFFISTLCNDAQRSCTFNKSTC